MLCQGFWAPEQLYKDKTYRTEPDFWTLGVCAYHWASGTLPFAGKEHDEVKDAIKSGKYEAIPEFKKVHGLEELCKDLMHLEPSERLGIR